MTVPSMPVKIEQMLGKLPRGCLPGEGEWTVFSAVIQENSSKDEFKVVSMGSGTKCLSKGELSPRGDLLSDSHAEVIAIRAFRRYLMNEMKSHSLIFKEDHQGFTLEDNVKFHFFTTHPPCGDATIFPKPSTDEDDDGPARKKLKMEENNFTGAKLIDPEEGSDVLSQDLGAVRTKPGRGERTLSMSCSDKMAKWLVMGVQGCLLSSLLKSPIFLESITFANNSGYHRESLERALWKRFSGCNEDVAKERRIPKIFDSSEFFPFAKADSKSPCPKSIIWCAVDERPLEISVDGRRQGVAKKNITKPSSRLKISRIELLRQFIPVFMLKNPAKGDILDLSYGDMKRKFGQDYQSKWARTKKGYFKLWTDKPVELNAFRLSNDFVF